MEGEEISLCHDDRRYTYGSGTLSLRRYAYGPEHNTINKSIINFLIGRQ